MRRHARPPARGRSPARDRCRGRRATRTGGRSARVRTGVIPGPVSATETEIVPLLVSTSSIRPPSGVQRNAFVSRFETIWRTRSPSVTITARAFSRSHSRCRAAGPPRRRRRRPGRPGAHVDLLVKDREAVGVELGEVEHVADKSLEPFRLHRHDASETAAASGSSIRPSRALRHGRESPSAAYAAHANGHQEVAFQFLSLAQPGAISRKRSARWLTSLAPRHLRHRNRRSCPARPRRRPGRGRARDGSAGARGTPAKGIRATTRPPSIARASRSSSGTTRVDSWSFGFATRTAPNERPQSQRAAQRPATSSASPVGSSSNSSVLPSRDGAKVDSAARQLPQLRASRRGKQVEAGVERHEVDVVAGRSLELCSPGTGDLFEPIACFV